jgi:hypothetical protein
MCLIQHAEVYLRDGDQGWRSHSFSEQASVAQLNLYF